MTIMKNRNSYTIEVSVQAKRTENVVYHIIILQIWFLKLIKCKILNWQGQICVSLFESHFYCGMVAQLSWMGKVTYANATNVKFLKVNNKSTNQPFT